MQNKLYQKIPPHFLCVGAQKAGTTTLHDILVQHPEIYLPEIKETKFFQDNYKYNKGLIFYKKEFFSKWRGEKIVGEIDPEYLYFEYVPGRIYRAFGKNIKLIFMLRNPIDRAYSHYWMSYGRGYETKNFEQAIELESERIKVNGFNKNHFSYIDRGFYAKQIERYLNFFSKKNMFFIIFEEDFLKNRERMICFLLDFLEVDVNIKLNLDIKSNPSSLPKLKILRDFIYKQNCVKKIGRILIPNKKIRNNILTNLDKLNKKPIKPPKLDKNFRRKLLFTYFINDIKKLENIISRDLKIWYE